MDAMLAGIPSELFAEWMAYAELEPFGGAADNHRTGTLAATIANTSGKLEEPMLPSDFFPNPDLEEQQPERDDLAARLIAAWGNPDPAEA
mgnify:CR=1 FL=1